MPNRRRPPSPLRRIKPSPEKPGNGQDQPQPKRDWIILFLTLLSSLSGVAALCTVIPTYLAVSANNTQLQLAKQDRFNTAITQLGYKDPDAQLGAINTLKSMIQYLPDDRSEIVEYLCLYIRIHYPAPPIANPEIYTGADSSPPLQIRSALHVIKTAGSSGDSVDLHDADLRGVDLSGWDLAGANFSGALLAGANLGNADLEGVDFNGANLNHADLNGARLSHAKINNAYLINATLRSSFISQAELRGVHLSGANLVLVNAWGSDFQGANLDNVDFLDCTLTGAILRYASLRAANLTNCALYSADLEHANLTGATLARVSYWNVNHNGAIGFNITSGNVLPPKS
jgi:hypothetical protein